MTVMWWHMTVMCHLSMKFSDTFDQNPPCTFNKIRGTNSNRKCSYSLTLRAKVKVIAKIKSQCPREQKNLSKNILVYHIHFCDFLNIKLNYPKNTSKLLTKVWQG